MQSNSIHGVGFCPVHLITHNWAAKSFHGHSDLMSPTGLDGDVNQRYLVVRIFYCPMSDCLFCPFERRFDFLYAEVSVFDQPRSFSAALLFWPPFDKGVVCSVDFSVGKLGLEVCFVTLVAGEDHDA
jgi:hypothetical protein